jgi:hypothetical protein
MEDMITTSWRENEQIKRKGSDTTLMTRMEPHKEDNVDKLNYLEKLQQGKVKI